MDRTAVNKKAEELGINAYMVLNASKAELIRAVQRAEGFSECFGSLASGCQYEATCCWVEDCYPEARRKAKSPAPKAKKSK